MRQIKYVGGLNSGTMEDPLTRQTFSFEKGKAFSVPDSTAEKLLSEQPETGADWVAENNQQEAK